MTLAGATGKTGATSGDQEEERATPQKSAKSSHHALGKTPIVEVADLMAAVDTIAPPRRRYRSQHRVLTSARPSGDEPATGYLEDTPVTRGIQSPTLSDGLVLFVGILRTLYEWCCWLGPDPWRVGSCPKKDILVQDFLVSVAGRHVRSRKHHFSDTCIDHSGDNVVLSEGVLLDARHSESDNVIHIGDDDSKQKHYA